MTPEPTCNILCSTRQPVYYLQSCCIDRKTGVRTDWARLLHLSEAEMRAHGLERVMVDLREFQSRDIAHRSVPDFKSAEGRRDAKARRESVPILITLLPADTIEFTPKARWSRSAWTGLTDRAIVLQQPITPLAFFTALSDAFARCIP